MHRREALLGSGVVLAAVAALPATAVESSGTGAYDISLGVEPVKGADQFLCRLSLRPAESGRIQQSEHAFKRGRLCGIAQESAPGFKLPQQSVSQGPLRNHGLFAGA